MLDLVALTSENEPFGRVLVEAMAAGKPLVATEGGGVKEIVVDRETGLLVPVGNVEAIAGAINWLLENPERARSMGVAGKRRAELFFSVEAHATNVQTLYNELLSR
ncbi:MAG: glycosyltransferase family 4 protein, partial [Chloroflexi bacterium]|nr:glycosyltransferase family 4 protein [Chloroflexota bacterium]